MDRLLSVLNRDTKRPVQAIGCSAIFYPIALIALKRDYATPVIVSQLHIK